MKLQYLLFIFLSLAITLTSCEKDDDEDTPTPTANTGGGNGGGNGGGGTQDPGAPFLVISTDRVEFSTAAGSQQITVTSNVDWTVQDNGSWLNTSVRSGTGDGTFSIFADANNTSGFRTAFVTVEAGDLSETISVRQDRNSSKGAVTFYKPSNYFNTIHLYFDGDFVGTLGSGSRYASSPGCYASDCITMDDLSYGSYSWRGDVYNAAGTTVLYTDAGTVRVEGPCKTVEVFE